MAKFIVTNQLQKDALPVALLEAAGVKPEMVRRLVLDFTVGAAAIMTVETYADDSQLRIDADGIEVVPATEDDEA